MASRSDILTQNVNTYPNNNSGAITPASVKNFNANWINSVAFTDEPTPSAVSASYAQNATSASQAANANTAISASFATNVTSASYAVNAGSATSSSFATNAATASFLLGSIASASFATSASFSTTAATASSTPNALITASVAASTITFTKGDGSTFNIVVAQSGSVATASLALDSERLGGVLPSGYLLTSSFTSYTGSTTSNFAGTASFANNVVSASYAVNASNSISASFATNANTSISASFATNANNATTATTATNATSASYSQNATSASYALNATTAASATSASYANNTTTASFASNIADGLNISASSINVTGNETILGNLTVNGTASFGYTTTTTGSAVIIGDEFIILNADTPTLPFAGIKVYDTGSNTTASFEWNGNNDYWIAVEETGNSAAFLTGVTGSKGAEAFPAQNSILKGTGNNQVVVSNISDNGTTVLINSNAGITGSIVANPLYSGTQQPTPVIEAFGISSTKGGNYISIANSNTAFTGSMILSGSNNIALASNGVSNSGVVAGRLYAVNGIGNIFNTITSCYISGSNTTLRAPSINASNISALILTDNRPTINTVPVTITNCYIPSSTTTTISTGSLSISTSTLIGSGFKVTGSTSTQYAPAGNTLIGTTNLITFDTNVGTASSSFSYNIVIGQNNLITLTGSLNPTIQSSALIGYNLVATGSNFATSSFGSTILGRWNAQDGTDILTNTVFAIGTGTGESARRTSFHVSSSGLTTISNGLITGSLIGTASFATSASYSNNAELLDGKDSTIFATTGSNTFIGNQTVTGSFNISGSIFMVNGSDLVTHHIKAEGSNGLELFANNGALIASMGAGGGTQANFTGSLSSTTFTSPSITGSLQGTASYALNSTTASYAQNIGPTLTQNLVLSGSVIGRVTALSISSQTASLDLSTSNFYTLQLVSGSNTFINPSNIQIGQTINILLSTTGSGTVSFPSSVKQVSGSAYVPTTTTSKDIITLISYDATNLYLANVKNLV